MTIVPYIRQISARAKALDETSCDDEKVWFGEFEDRITRLIHRALVLKIRLVGGDCEHEFLSPNHGDVFNANSMQHTIGEYPDPRKDLGIVVTKFPGLRIKVEQYGQPLTLFPSGAVVRTQKVKEF